MRTKSLVLLLLALGCGLIASIGISQVIERSRGNDSAPQVEMVDIVVAKQEIKSGEKLKVDMLELAKWPKDNLPEGCYQSIEDATKNAFKLRTVMLKGDPIVEGKFQNKNEDVTRNIPPGYRVAAVQTDAAAAAGNLINPNDRVDVLLYVAGNGNSQQAAVKTILQNIAVFSVNDKTNAGGEVNDGNGGEKNTRYVTLLVKPEQSRVLALAKGQGTIQLTLRSPDDPHQDAEEVLDPKRMLQSPSTANNPKEEDKAFGFSSALGGFLETLSEAAQKNAAANAQLSSQVAGQPAVAPAQPTTSYETFQTMIIEGSQTRIESMSRELKNPKAGWLNDSLKPTNRAGTAATNKSGAPTANVAPGTTTPAAFGLPNPPSDSAVKNLTF